MSFRVDIELPVEKISELEGEVVRAISDWKEGILKEIETAGKYKAFQLSYQRMPKGGSYVDHIKWRNTRRTPKEYVSELYNDHQWARAVETGTKPHRITSDKLMTARPILAQPGGKGRSWGMKYGPGAIVGRAFDHPGSRAFHIFRDTAKHIDSIAGIIVEEVFRRIRKR